MPELVNYTPFPNFRYYSRNSEDEEFGIVIVKATYELTSDGKLVVAEEQAPLVFTDRCHGEVNISSLWHPSDLVPKKPATDIIVNAVARTVGGAMSPSWQCGIGIDAAGRRILDKRLSVTGPRNWRPQWKRELNEGQAREWQQYRKLFAGWEMSAPEPVDAVPLHYEYAYGGEIETGADEEGRPVFDTDQHNPLGKGKIHTEWTDHTKPVVAPQIEDLAEPITDPYKAYRPANLAPIPPAWLPRRPLGGTYDQDWIDHRWPAWPADYSFSYHNSAHPDLVVTPYLKGDETIVLEGLSAEVESIEFSLPGMVPKLDLMTPDGDIYRADMVLDTVFLDIAARRHRDWRIFLSWRVNFEPDRFSVAVIHHDASDERHSPSSNS